MKLPAARSEARQRYTTSGGKRLRLALTALAVAVVLVAGISLKTAGPAAAAPTPYAPALGAIMSCTLHDNGFVGSAQCWGSDLVGQLGDGSADSGRMAPAPVVSLGNIVGLATSGSGGDHMCALMADDTVKCWGRNTSGQLGANVGGYSPNPVTVSGITDAQYIAAGYNHSCALRTTGAVVCWGENGEGQLGDGTTTDTFTPVTVSGISTGVWITAGYQHTCAVLADGTARCWGDNFEGQLGNGTTTDSLTPVTVSGLVGADRIDAGTNHTCARGGVIYCWGQNFYGQLGIGTTTPSYVPVAVPGTTSGMDFSTGQLHTCHWEFGMSPNVKCWGDNSGGQIGDGTTTQRNSPTAVMGFASLNVSWMDAGGGATCAVVYDGTTTTRCWGDNFYGTLGDCTTTNSPVPVTVIYDDGDCDLYLDATPEAHQGPANTNTLADNCPSYAYNSPQLNADGNFVDTSPPRMPGQDDLTWPKSDRDGDACDIDDDNDALDDIFEPGPPCASASAPTDPLLRDTDGDRFLDGAECTLGTDPANAASKPTLSACGTTSDTDSDGLSNRLELCFYNTKSTAADTDGDGEPDRCEVTSLNADTVTGASDLAIAAGVIALVTAYHPGLDPNKDGVVGSSDLAMIAGGIIAGC